MVDPELLDILVCPETKQPVRLADAELLDRLNAAIRGGTVRTRGGEPVTEPLTECLVRGDGAVAYPVRDEIPVMLIDEALSLQDLPPA